MSKPALLVGYMSIKFLIPSDVPFEVLETPLVAQLKEASALMDSRRLPWLTALRITAAIYLQRTCLFIYLLALVCGILRAVLLPNDQGTWVETALLQPLYVALPLLPLTLPLLWVSANL